MFAGNFNPRSWAFCDGQLLNISQNDALFSLLGTIYGGDGRTTFGLPDLRGRVPIHMGSGPGLTPRQIGSRGGQENVTLTVNQLPPHTHPLQATTANATSADPTDKILAKPTTVDLYRPGSTANTDMDGQAITNTGGSQNHTNLQPFLCIHFIIALFGVYPSRN